MPEINAQNFGVGILFPYVHPIDDEDDFRQWSVDHGYNPSEDQPRGVIQTDQGILVSGGGAFAERGNFQILFNPEASLDGYDSCSFVTFKDAQGADFEPVIEDTRAFINEFPGADFNDVDLFEVTYSSHIRIDRDVNDLSRIFEASALDSLSEISGEIPKGRAAIFKGDVSDNRTPGWYRLLFDTDMIQSPHLWGCKLTYRLGTLDDIDGGAIEAAISDFIEQTGPQQ